MNSEKRRQNLKLPNLLTKSVRMSESVPTSSRRNPTFLRRIPYVFTHFQNKFFRGEIFLKCSNSSRLFQSFRSRWQPYPCGSLAGVFLCVSRLSSKAIRLCSLKAVMAFLWPMTFSVIILVACVKVEKWNLSPCFARATTCWLIRLLPGSTIYIFVTSWIR